MNKNLTKQQADWLIDRIEPYVATYDVTGTTIGLDAVPWDMVKDLIYSVTEIPGEPLHPFGGLELFNKIGEKG